MILENKNYKITITKNNTIVKDELLKYNINKEQVIFLPFTHNTELSTNGDVLCVQDMKRTYSGKTYMTYGFKYINNRIKLVNCDNCDGYLLVSKRDIRSIPEFQRKHTKDIEQYAKERIDKIVPQINAYINDFVYNLDVINCKDLSSWVSVVFSEDMNGVMTHLEEHTPYIDDELEELIRKIK